MRTYSVIIYCRHSLPIQKNNFKIDFVSRSRYNKLDYFIIYQNSIYCFSIIYYIGSFILCEFLFNLHLLFVKIKQKKTDYLSQTKNVG